MLNPIDYQFYNKCQELYDKGERREGRNGVTFSEFGTQWEFDLRERFPILSIKKMNFMTSAAETFGFLEGVSSADAFAKLGCNFWKANAEATYWMENPFRNEEIAGDLGRIYGVQWREWRGVGGDGQIKVVDQLEDLRKNLLKDPYGRRHIVSAWNPAELDQMALPPCHSFFQVYCHSDNGISLKMYQRSCDLFLGVPYNITSYALILSILGSMTSRQPRKLIMSFGDLHFYETHELDDHVLKKMRVHISQDTGLQSAPRLHMPDMKGISFNDLRFFLPIEFKVENYTPMPLIPAKMIA